MLVRRNDRKLPLVESLSNLTLVAKYLCRFFVDLISHIAPSAGNELLHHLNDTGRHVDRR